MKSRMEHGCPRGSRPRASSVVALAVAGCAVTAAGGARAQLVGRLALRAEGGVGTMLSAVQQDELRYALGFQGTGRVAFNVAPAVSFQLSVANWFFPRDGNQTGRLAAYTGGLRLEPAVGSLGRVFLDGNAGIGSTGPVWRFTFDVGLGFEFALERFLAVGPV